MEQTESTMEREPSGHEWQEEIRSEVVKPKKSNRKGNTPKQQQTSFNTNSTKTSFLDLPAEVRQQILEYMCRDAVSIPSKPLRYRKEDITKAMFQLPFNQMTPWDKEHEQMNGYRHPYTQWKLRNLDTQRSRIYCASAIEAKPEIHRWAEGMMVVDERLFGDVRAVERALIRKLRGEHREVRFGKWWSCSVLNDFDRVLEGMSRGKCTARRSLGGGKRLSSMLSFH